MNENEVEITTIRYRGNLYVLAKDMEQLILREKNKSVLETTMELINKPKESSTMKVEYPVVGDIGTVGISFTKPLTPFEVENVQNIVNYWTSIPYVGELLGTRWSSSQYLNVDVDTTKSTSYDIGARNILEQLGSFITDGTPVRKTKNNTRRFTGIGKVVSLIKGF